MGGKEPDSEYEGVRVLEARFDVQEKGGDFKSGSLASSALAHEGEAGVA